LILISAYILSRPTNLALQRFFQHNTDMTLITVLAEGLYCEQGSFFIDPWKPVERALITHAHSDHARVGSQHYIATKISEGILQKRLGDRADMQGVEYGERLKLGNTWV